MTSEKSSKKSEHNLNPQFDFANITQDEALIILKEYNLALTYSEALKIQELLNRAPTLSECILWGIQGSEHCSYKSSKNHLKKFVTDGPNVILGAKEDAGVIRVCKDETGLGYGLVISHESHNHPSQVVPFEGAATGIGGNIRDVTCMGAEVIALADGLRFGDFNNPKTHWIYDGVVSGLASYGNAIGVPNITGDAYFHSGFKDNCLVTVTTLGSLKDDEIIHSYAPKGANNYALILVGKPTDNSGFGGASFASVDLEEEDSDANKGAVQEPNAFLGRMMMKISKALFKKLKAKNLLDKVGFKDLGAGGIACASVEIAEVAGYGARVKLDEVPVSMENLAPAVILCAETQERYMWCCPPDLVDFICDHYNKEYDLPNISKGACAKVVGHITDDQNYKVSFKDQILVNAKASDITEGILYDRPYEIIDANSKQTKDNLEKINNFKSQVCDGKIDLSSKFYDLMGHPNLASKQNIYQYYDKQVQGRMLVTRDEADAGVLLPFDEKDDMAVALAIASNPYYGQIDAGVAGVSAVVEAVQKVISVGGNVQAITDCLCFGNPEKTEQMGDFVSCVEGIKAACENLCLINREQDFTNLDPVANDTPIPIVAGNVSLYNESKSGAVPASPMISAVGSLHKDQVIKPDFVKEGEVIVLIGDRQAHLGGSLWYELNSLSDVNLPKFDLDKIKIMNKTVLEIVDLEIITSLKAINLGGFATTLALMGLRHQIGCDIKLEPSSLDSLRSDEYLFSEAPGFVLTIPADKVERALHKLVAQDISHWVVGVTKDSPKVKIYNSVSDKTLLEADLSKLKSNWENGLDYE